jgi:hypothetical protein
LNGRGYRVIRFWNHQVLIETESVLEAVLLALVPPLPDPPPQGGRERVRSGTDRERVRQAASMFR